jgi:VWFA-related protein
MLGLFCALLAPALLIPSSSQEVQQDPIRIEVEAVNVLVSVTDSKGRHVTDLTQDRFRVFENGAPQELTNFSIETDLPLQIGLLIDTSASVRTKLGFEKAAATNFVRSVMRPQDQTLLVEFDSGVTLINDFTTKPAEIADKLQKLRAGGGTALLDAVYAVSRDKMGSANVRKTIILVSDGADLNSKRSVREAVEMAQSSGVTVYGIGTNRFGASGNKKGEAMLNELAKKTGGRAFFPYSSERMEDAFQLIDDELRSRYSLTYIPENKDRDGKFRKLKVKLEKGKKYKLRYREGYFAPAE